MILILLINKKIQLSIISKILFHSEDKNDQNFYNHLLFREKKSNLN